MAGDQTRYVYSDLFRLRQGETFTFDTLHFSDEPPPIPVSIIATADIPTLTEIDQTAQITATATLGNGGTKDVSTIDEYTTYRNSNPSIVRVDQNGLVEGDGVYNGRE